MRGYRGGYPDVDRVLEALAQTYAIFVTREPKLKQRVRALTSNALIIEEPDTLVSILNRLAVTSEDAESSYAL